MGLLGQSLRGFRNVGEFKIEVSGDIFSDDCCSICPGVNPWASGLKVGGKNAPSRS